MKIATRIILYFLLTYAFTWYGFVGHYFDPTGPWENGMNSLGPILAAPIVVLLTEGLPGVWSWLKRILRFNAPLYVYGAAIFGTLAIILVSMTLTMLIFGDRPQESELAAWPEVLKAAPFIVFLGGPFGEEPGFRGYGQHTLHQIMSPRTASLWIGLGVLIWHAPVFIMGGITPAIGFAIVAVSVVYAWLYQAGGSIWPLIALHGTVNIVNGVFFGRMLDAREQLVEQGFLSLFFVCWALFLGLKFGPTLGHPVRK